MKRSYLKVGDKSSVGGTVVEGIALTTHHGTQLTFLGAIVVCPACKSSWVIAEKGPRWPGEMMGKRAALEGDICICNCNPPPVMIASQTIMTMSFESNDLVLMGFSPTGSALEKEPVAKHWIQFSLKDQGSYEGLHCRAHFADGSIEDGIVDASNTVHIDRPNASICQKVEKAGGAMRT
jgi:uncharacterized Zn-binding protein involved in type VI secretion